MQHIIGMPPQVIIIGMPMAIMDAIFSQHIFIISMVMPPSIGIILQTMPASVISTVILHIGIIIGIGIPIPPPIIGIGMPMPPPIIGIIMDIMLGIVIIPMGMFIGICMGIGICIAGIIFEDPSIFFEPNGVDGQSIPTIPQRSNRHIGAACGLIQ
ncbi:hypothetical protein [Telmatospirillum siberiense]|uniref:hypothetical protein n=1 Tax=Telmatospirillum siberiense TaxID=382514 RepID=UPI0013046113|nr:hypothetical protein [Telmatospirillum siberiense]